MLRRSTVTWVLFLAAVGGLPPAQAAAAQGPCTTATHCIVRPRFTASITDVRVSGTLSNRYVTLLVRFQNPGATSVRLGYVARSPSLTDDRGRRYTLNGEVRGLGEIDGSSVDPKFEIPSGEWADARLEFGLNTNELVGTRYDLEFAVREILPVAGNQIRLGNEHLLAWEGLAPPGATPPAAPLVATKPTRVAPGCEERPRCTESGPLTLEVTRMTSALSGRELIITSVIRARNTFSAPLILAYQKSTGEMTDNAGNRFEVDLRFEGRIRGIGETDGEKADPSFTLEPGGEGTFSIAVSRYVGNREPQGQVFTLDFVLEELGVLPSRQITKLRERAITFGDLKLTTADAASAAVEEAGRGVLNGLIKRLKGNN